MSDATEMARTINNAVAVLMQNRDVAFSATPLDVMGPEGVERAYVILTLNPTLLQFLERGLALAMDEQRRQEGGETL